MRTQHLNAEEKQSLQYICEEYGDLFHLEGEPLTSTAAVKHEINTRADTASVNVRPYRLPNKHKTEVNRQSRYIMGVLNLLWWGDDVIGVVGDDVIGVEGMTVFASLIKLCYK